MICLAIKHSEYNKYTTTIKHRYAHENAIVLSEYYATVKLERSMPLIA